MLTESDLTITGLRLAEHQLALGDTGCLQLGEAERPNYQHRRCDGPDHARAAANLAREPRPDTGRVHAVFCEHSIRFKVRAFGPERAAAEEVKDGR